MLFANAYYMLVCLWSKWSLLSLFKVPPTSKVTSQSNNLKGPKQEQESSPHTGGEFLTNNYPQGQALATCFNLKMLVLNLDRLVSWQRLYRNSIPMSSKQHTRLQIR